VVGLQFPGPRGDIGSGARLIFSWLAWAM